ncbi:MAG: ROK family transcriptional regulator, partial [Candidatus Latescibacterota bacterium]
YAVNLFHPQAVFVGGGMTELGEYLLGPMREALREFALSDRAEVPVKVSSLGEWVGALGAALYAWTKVL